MNNTWRRPPRAHRLLGATFSLAFLFLVGWLVHIPYMKVEGARGPETLAEKAERQQTVEVDIPPFRGAIVDAQGRPLAMMAEAYDVFADPRLVHQGRVAPGRAAGSLAAADPRAAPVLALTSALYVETGHNQNRVQTARQLAPLLGLDAAEIDARIAENPIGRFVLLKRRVDRPTKEAIDAMRLHGIGTALNGKRCYPAGKQAAHVTGIVGCDNQGLGGLEYLFDERLRGAAGFRKVQVDGKRRPIWIRPDDYRPAQDGQLLVLTIDLTIQTFVEESLEKAVKQFRARGGSAIVMDPRTGEIVAMANYPSFDPTDFADADAYAMRNRLLTDPYEPGSTFKCFIASMALEKGVVRRGEKIFCHNGVYVIRGRRLRDVHPYGTLTFEEVVVKSSNIGMGIIGERMGNERLFEAIRCFGFGEPTGIALPGEGAGVVYPLERWSGLSATSIPMGYEVLVTPLQLITGFSAIANGGKLMKPRIVRYAYGPDRRLVADESEPVVVRQVLRRETADYMRRNVFRQVVVEGTGKKAAVPGYRVFGKTGTAKKPNPNGPGYSNELFVGSFLGAAPLENPRLVVLVLIDEPDRSVAYYGGSVAAPAVKEILEKSLGYLRVPPEEAARLARSDGPVTD